MRITLLEDGSWVADELARALSAGGFAVDLLPCDERTARAAIAPDSALVIVDLSCGTLDGAAVLRALREGPHGAAMLVLAARDRLGERVQALEMGADVMGEPFAMPELAAKVRALLRRANGQRATRIVHGALTVDHDARRAYLHGAPLVLLPREWAVLAVLLQRVERVVSKEMIAEVVGGHGKALSRNSIETYVSRLRTKLQPAGVRIRTVHGFGYMLEAPAPLHAKLQASG